MAGDKPGPARLYETAGDLKDAIETYLLDLESKNQEMIDKGMPQLVKKPALTRMILSLGLGSRTAFDKYKTYGDDFKAVVDWGKLNIEASYEETVASGHGNVAGGIFALKNFGWKDKHEVEHGGAVSSDIRYTAHMPKRGSEDE